MPIVYSSRSNSNNNSCGVVYDIIEDNLGAPERPAGPGCCAPVPGLLQTA